MSQADYDAKLAQFQAIAIDGLKKPNMPIKIYVQEAENQYHWCQQDKEALLGAGINWALVEDMPLRIGAVRFAEAYWLRMRNSREDAALEWEKEAPKAYALRDKLLRDMRFAYRDNPVLLKRVSEITEGSGHADMIQDLVDIAVLGRDFAEPLQNIRLKLEVLDQAVDLAGTLGELLAQVNGERSADNSARVVRDQAYTLLKQAVDEVRAYGQYVFWDNPARLEGYYSDRLRTQRRNAANKAPAPDEVSEASPE